MSITVGVLGVGNIGVTVCADAVLWGCLVVGVDDETFGQRVTGVASLREGSDTDSEALREFARTNLAAFKAPKQLFVVEAVQRAANGKADYGWAREAVEKLLETR